MTGSPTIHVERTGDPAVMRWVLNHPPLVATAPGRREPPASSPLGALQQAGDIASIVIRDGDAFIRAGDERSWATIAAGVREALVVELEDLGAHRSGWMLEAVESEHATLTVDEARQIVDRVAGAAMLAHGGSLTVVTIDGSTLHLAADGACHGCNRSDDTVLALITPAIQSADPQIRRVVVDEAPGDQPTPLITRPVRFLRRRRDGGGGGGGGGGCH